MARAVARRPAGGRFYPRPPAGRPVSGSRVVPDSSETFLAVEDWLGARGDDAALRAEHLVAQNRGLLADLGVRAEVGRQRGETGLRVRTSTRVGAIPLLSPVTARPDFGLVVAPRFSWSSVGDLLSATGFRVVPDLLPLPDLPHSERRIPPWVMSSVVLLRMQRLLEAQRRRFTMTAADRPAPRGSVDWTAYATQRLPVARPLAVPCRYPDLRDDEELRAAIHYVVRRHRDSLAGQTGAGVVVRDLLALCDALLARLAGAPALPPAARTRSAWQRQPLASRVFREGLQALDWTIDERGLAGLSDLSGLSWRMDMEVFFEAWVEALAEHAARRAGALLRAGRTAATRVPVDWRPPHAGSQRALVPDVVLERADAVVVLDAKYKRHAEQIERLGWWEVDAELREQHRADVLQALAYSTLFDAPRVVAALVYPCQPETWERLAHRGRTLVRARVRGGARAVELALLSVPLAGPAERPARDVEVLLQQAAG